MIRRAIAAAFIALAAVVPAPADGTAIPAVAPLTEQAFRDVALGPLEDVVPVAPSAARTPVAPGWAPTSISGRALAWPRLWAGETGTVSTYGPGYRGYLALPYPWGAGWVVEVCGQAGCITRVSNDYGPERRLHRIADLSVEDFEAIAGVSWRMGLTTATVTVKGRAE